MFKFESEAESDRDEAPIVLIQRQPDIDPNSDVLDEELDSLDDSDDLELTPLDWKPEDTEANDYFVQEDPKLPPLVWKNYEDPGAVYSHENFSWCADDSNIPTKNYRWNSAIPEPGPSPHLADLRVPSQIVDQFFTGEILYWIQVCTNEYAKSNEADFSEVDSVELKAFFAALILNGAFGKGTVYSMFSTRPDGLQLPISMAFSRARFEKLMKYLRFDKVSERKKGEKDRLHKIRHVFESLVGKFQANYVCGKNVTVDEAMIAYRGKATFRQYIKNKPCKYGIKAWACNDSKTFYLHNAQIYTGKEGDSPEVGQAQRVALQMVENLKNCGRTLYTDNFYTSPELVRELHSARTYCVGTVRANKKGIPRELAKSMYQIDGTLQNFEPRAGFLFCTNLDCPMTLVKYEAKHHRSVFLLSSKHIGAKVATKVGEKPEIIYDYNASKGGVDSMDQMLGTYSCSLPTRHWPLRIFFWLLDVVYLNSFIIYSHLVRPKNVFEICHRRRNFLKLAVYDFLQVQITRRLSQDNVHHHVMKLANVAHALKALDLTRDKSFSTNIDVIARSPVKGDYAIPLQTGRFSRGSSRVSGASSCVSSVPSPSEFFTPNSSTKIFEPERRRQRKRCELCELPAAKRPKTEHFCRSCNKAICRRCTKFARKGPNHEYYVCKNCEN